MRNIKIKSTVLSFLFLVTLAACTTTTRAPTSTGLQISDLSFPSKMTKENCSSELDSFQRTLTSFRLQQTELASSSQSLQIFENKNFQFRKTMTALNLPETCVLQLRSVYTGLRNLRDYAAEKIHEKSSQNAISFQLPGMDLNQYQFRTGDVLITRGNSFLSATISQISSNHSQYSHVAYVYVDPSTHQAYTLESYPTKGARIYPMAEALKNDNTRIQLFRPRDA